MHHSMESKRYGRLLRNASRGAAIIATATLAVQFILRISTDRVKLVEPARTESVVAPPPAPSTPESTMWQLLRNDSRLSKFADIVGEIPGFVANLDNPSGRVTIFAPTNTALEKEHFAWDLPSFYWLYVAGYNMGPGAFSRQDLFNTTTVPAFISADVFGRYRQRISTQRLENGDVSFNFEARYAAPEVRGVNGYIHLLDRVLLMPESTSDLLRDDPDLSIIRKGLIETDVAVVVNDTSTHLGQTVFAPSNDAFKKLGPKANQFLFSRYGNEYLKALVQYHVVANQTMFTNVLFPHNGDPQIPLKAGSKINLPTLLPGQNLSVTIDIQGSGMSMNINNGTGISQADIIVMDGVVHKTDTVLLPPLLPDKGETPPLSGESWLNALLDWIPGSGMPVGELKKRLQPIVDDFVPVT